MREDQEFADITQALNATQCSLACASAALGLAQDEGDTDLAAKAWKVINGCAIDLDRLQHDLAAWHMRRDHTPRVHLYAVPDEGCP